MPTWSGLAKELEEEFIRRDGPPFDYVRRKYLASLSAYTQCLRCGLVIDRDQNAAINIMRLELQSLG